MAVRPSNGPDTDYNPSFDQFNLTLFLDLIIVFCDMERFILTFRITRELYISKLYLFV